MSLFGNNNTSNTSNTGSGLFGNASSTTNTANPSPFGGGLFGAKPATAAPASGSTPQPTTNLFGGASAAPAAGTGGGLFGGASSTPAAGGNLFGGASSTTTPAAGTGGNLFGAPPAAPAATTGGGLFGGGAASNLFGGGGTAIGSGLFGAQANKPATPATTTPVPNSLFGNAPASTAAKSETKPGIPNFFGGAAPSTAAPSTTAPAPSAGGGLFGLPPKPAESTTAGSTLGSAPSTTTAGGGLFGAAPKPAAGTTPAAPSPFSLGGASASNLFGAQAAPKPEDKKDPAPAAPAPAFNLFGGAKPADKKDTPAATTTVATTATATTEKKDTPATNASSAVVTIPPPSMLRGKTLEEIVSRWTTELDSNVREFNKFAAEVAVWDRALIENGNDIAALFSHVQAAERQQNDINEALEHIEQQQNDLATTLDAYEKVSQEVLGGQGGSLKTLDSGPADAERDKNYLLATELHTHLDDLAGSLTQMIDSVNSLSIGSKASEPSDDAMSQIAQILSSHLESLQWIDTAVREVESKTTEVEKKIRESGHSLSGNKSRAFGLNR